MASRRHFVSFDIHFYVKKVVNILQKVGHNFQKHFLYQSKVRKGDYLSSHYRCDKFLNGLSILNNYFYLTIRLLQKLVANITE